MLDFLMNEEYWKSLLSPQAQANLTEKLIIVAVVWATMGRKVTKHFAQLKSGLDTTLGIFREHLKAIEDKLENGIIQMKGMRDAVGRDLDRLGAVESGLSEVKTRVEKLEKPRGG